MSIVFILSIAGWIATAMVGFYGLKESGRLAQIRHLGDMDVDCLGSHNCFLDGATDGLLSVSDSSYTKAYGTSTGWDSATGIGTINVNNLLKNWASAAAAAVAREASH